VIPTETHLSPPDGVSSFHQTIGLAPDFSFKGIPLWEFHLGLGRGLIATAWVPLSMRVHFPMALVAF